MSDRELLVLAAKAAGMRLLSVEVFPNGYAEAVREGFNPNGGNIWNPLNDDGDAFRLASSVMLTVEFGNNCVLYPVEAAGTGTSPLAATRRAIVRAAAEIGKAMP